MSESQVPKKKRKKRQLQVLEHVQEDIAIQNAIEVTKALDRAGKAGSLP